MYGTVVQLLEALKLFQREIRFRPPNSFPGTILASVTGRHETISTYQFVIHQIVPCCHNRDGLLQASTTLEGCQLLHKYAKEEEGDSEGQ